jgi:glucosamine--fructose-6-phosphate aminotransferase (isomerizing)
MCGIIGYFGEQEATPLLMDGLQRLEYRGYDSAGIAVMDRSSGCTRITKSDSKVANLEAKVRLDSPSGRLGIGHTRWATHGKPTVVNAHPHVDCAGRVVVVHNGIIENFAELRAELEVLGHRFISETDTEVLPHLIEAHYQGDFVSAVLCALRRVRGAYAMAAFSVDNPQLLVGARLNAPLVVGMGVGEWFIASDITAILPYTKSVLLLGEGQVVAIGPKGPKVITLDGKSVKRELIAVDWDASQAQRGGYPHFMLKEIHECPESAASALRGRTREAGGLRLGRGGSFELGAPGQVLLLGMGTSLHAAMVGEHVIEEWTGIPARAADASEFRYKRPTVKPDTLTVVLTQSGETADTLVGMHQAREAGSRVLAVTNVVGSTAARDADAVIYMQCGPEIGVASTKTFVSHMISQYLLGLELAESVGSLDGKRRAELIDGLARVPDGILQVLAREAAIGDLARKYSEASNFLFVGRGIHYPIALEGALKLKEISYVHAEAVSGGALKHGPIALLDEGFPVIALCPPGTTKEKMVSNVHEMAARGAPIIAVVCDGDRSLQGVAADLLELPATGDEAFTAVLATVALQLFAYHMAVTLGRDVDQPRNLAKSVTVE